MIGSKRVLLVDDDPGVLETLAEVVDDMGLDYACVATGRMALRLLEESDSFDLAVLDIVLPDLYGYEVLGQIRCAEEPSAIRNTIPVIMSSGSTRHLEHCTDAQWCFRKPVDVPSFRRAVSALLLRNSESLTMSLFGTFESTLITTIHYLITNMHSAVIATEQSTNYTYHFGNPRFSPVAPGCSITGLKFLDHLSNPVNAALVDGKWCLAVSECPQMSFTYDSAGFRGELLDCRLPFSGVKSDYNAVFTWHLESGDRRAVYSLRW